MKKNERIERRVKVVVVVNYCWKNDEKREVKENIINY